MAKTKKGGMRAAVKRSSSPKFVFQNLLFISLFLSILSVVSVFLIKAKLPPQIPLFYGLAEGEEQLAPSIYILIPNLIGLIILLTNIVLSLLTDNHFYKKILIVAAFVMVVLVLITTIKIVFLVGSF